jgi:arginyl-tRNA synthetase
MDIRPMPDKQGAGFFSMTPIPPEEKKSNLGWGYREEVVGRYHNYYFTPDCYHWPDVPWYNANPPHYIVDAFSPNLDKQLHVGHLRNLALATSLSRIFNRNAEFVALLGASKGVLKSAQDNLDKWFKFVGYEPTLYYDVLMPRDEDIVVRRLAPMPKKAMTVGAMIELEECTVWDGPNGPVIVLRGDGKPLYTFHDIAFAKTVGPTHYVTGHEQTDHFKNLGLGDRHRPMGLVLGKTDKGWEKMKSRSGEAFLAEDLIQLVMEKLKEGKKLTKKTKDGDEFDNEDEYGHTDTRRLAWNVLAWNFLTCSREQNVKFDVDRWTDPNSGGLYITYTYARIKAALKKAGGIHGDFNFNIQPDERSMMAQGCRGFYEEDGTKRKPAPDPHYDLTQADANLLGWGSYRHYYKWRAMESFDPATLANYAHDLARKLGQAYHAERMEGGRYGFCHAVYRAMTDLWHTMNDLGMFTLEEV